MFQKRWIGAVLAVCFGLGSILNPLLIIGTADRTGLPGENTAQKGGVKAKKVAAEAEKAIPARIQSNLTAVSNRNTRARNESVAANSAALSKPWTMRQTGAGSSTPTPAARTWNTLSNSQFQILVRAINAEAGGEPFEGQVAVGAVLLNRIRSGRFPKTISANVFRNGEFESVSNGYIWDTEPTASAYRAATLAVKGWDPTGGALYFYNPAKSSSAWIWSRPIYTKIGSHYFAG